MAMNHKRAGRADEISKHITKHGYTIGAELGTKEGYVTGNLLNAHPNLKMIAVDLWDVQPDGREEDYITGSEKSGGCVWDHNAYYRRLLQMKDAYSPRLEVYKDYTSNVAKKFGTHYFDFIFIDADHSYEGVKQDIEDWSKLVRPGGIIFGHDYVKDWETKKPNHRFWGVNKAVDEAFGQSNINTGQDNVWYVYVPIRDNMEGNHVELD